MINLCFPDSEKSCPVCCGIFNHKNISKEFLGAFLREGTHRVTENHDGDLFQIKEHRDVGTYTCPYQGFVREGQPGCLLFEESQEKGTRKRSLYGPKICRDYLCPAHHLLSPGQQKLLVDHVHHWYPYSIAIALPLFTLKVMDIIEEKKYGYDPLLEKVLWNYSSLAAQQKGAIFHYSAAEMRVYKDDYTREAEECFHRVLEERKEE